MQRNTGGMPSPDRERTTTPRGSEIAHRFGTEHAERNRGRSWQDAEPELRRGWDSYPDRGDDRSTWDEVKDTVRDAWDRVTGGEGRPDSGVRRDERARI